MTRYFERTRVTLWNHVNDHILTYRVPSLTGECGRSLLGRLRKLGIFGGSPEERSSPKFIDTTGEICW